MTPTGGAEGVHSAPIMMAENTGIYFLSLSITTIFAIVADFGISPVVIREVAKKPDETTSLVRRALGLKVPLLLRAIISRDGMTADVYPFATKDLLEISARITNEVKQIGRVVYDISSKPPATIEWE